MIFGKKIFGSNIYSLFISIRELAALQYNIRRKIVLMHFHGAMILQTLRNYKASLKRAATSFPQIKVCIIFMVMYRDVTAKNFVLV